MRQTKRERDRLRKSRRKSESRRLKKTRRMRKKSPQKGGFDEYRYYIGNKVLTIVPREHNYIRKIYYNTPRHLDHCKNEEEKYKMFNIVDATYRYHGEFYGDSCSSITLNDLHPKLKEEILNDDRARRKNIDDTKSYVYIDMEYGGETLMNIPIDEKIRKAVLQFFIEVLQLQDPHTGLYLVHGDPHADNISCKIDTNGNYIIKYIDLSQIQFVPGDYEIKSLKDLYNSNIINQFASITGVIKHIFNYSDNETITELSRIVKIGRKYEDVLNDVLQKLVSILRNT